MTNSANNAGTPAENNPVDPRSLWRTITDPSTGKVTITNPEDDPWDTEVLPETSELPVPRPQSRWIPEPALLDLYVAMVTGERSKTRDFSDQVALDRCRHDVRTTITYVLR